MTKKALKTYYIICRRPNGSESIMAVRRAGSLKQALDGWTGARVADCTYFARDPLKKTDK